MKRPFTRLLALVGSIALGTAGALVLAAPAQAHHTDITVAKKCQDNQWVLTWTVTNSENDKTAKFVDMKVTPASSPITGFAKDTVIPKKQNGNGKVVGTQILPADATGAKLEIWVRWSNGHGGKDGKYDSGSIDLKGFDCGPEYTAAVGGSALCDREAGKWAITWTVSNGHPSTTAKATIINAIGDSDTTATKIGGSWVRLTSLSEISGLANGQTIPPTPAVTASQIVSGDATAARLKVKLVWQKNDKEVKTHYAVATVNFEGSCVKNAPKPSVSFASDCSGDVKVTLMNAGNATKEAIFLVTGSNGFSTEVKVAIGETNIVSVPTASSGSITVSEGGTELDKYTWQDSPKCHPVELRTSDTCGGVTVHLSNPENGATTTIVLTPTAGEVVTKTLAPGENASVEFSGTRGVALSVDVNVDGQKKTTVVWKQPSGCEPHDGRVESDCVGLTFDYSNPQDGSDVEIKLEPSSGDSVTFTLKPDETKQVTFKASGAKFHVNETVKGKTVAWDWEKPKNCPVPPDLPKTGSNTSGIVVWGSVLILLGGVVFMMARRRLVRLRNLAR